MTMSWSAITIKYILFIFNLLFVISGIIILSVGVTVKTYYYSYETFLEQQYFSAPNLLIAIGSIIFIIAFFGCCGAIKQNYYMIITFSTFLILIFLLEFAGGISGYVLRNETADYLNGTLFSSLKKYKNNHSETAVIWDELQRDFNCCGVNSYSDWIYTMEKLPLSCCNVPPGTIETFNCDVNTTSLHSEGCIVAFGNYVREHAVTIGGVGLGFASLQILGIMFSCHLARKIKLNYNYV